MILDKDNHIKDLKFDIQMTKDNHKIAFEEQ